MKNFFEKIVWAVWQKWTELKLWVVEILDEEVDIVHPEYPICDKKSLTIQAVQLSRDFTSILVEVTTPNGFVYPGIVRKDFALPATFAFHKGRPRHGELVVGVKRSTNGAADVVFGGSSLKEEFLADVATASVITWNPLVNEDGAQ